VIQSVHDGEPQRLGQDLGQVLGPVLAAQLAAAATQNRATNAASSAGIVRTIAKTFQLARTGWTEAIVRRLRALVDLGPSPLIPVGRACRSWCWRANSTPWRGQP